VAALLAPAAAARMSGTCQVTGTHLAVSSIVSNHAAGAACSTILALGRTQYSAPSTASLLRPLYSGPPRAVPPSFCFQPSPRPPQVNRSCEARGTARYLARSCVWVPATCTQPGPTGPLACIWTSPPSANKPPLFFLDPHPIPYYPIPYLNPTSVQNANLLS
jgi:hypothetical protein